MVIHTVHPESVNSNILVQSEKRQNPPSGSVPITFQQAPEVYRPHISTSVDSGDQRMLQMSSDNKKTSVPSSSFASVPQLNTAVCNASASSSLFGAPNVANPFLLAALIGMQQNQVASPLPNNIQTFSSLLPYLQQVQNNAQSEYLMQNLLALQQMAAVQHIAATSQNIVPHQQQTSQQWLSPPPSAASGSENVSSLALSTSEESLSVLSESSHVSPRPRGDVISPDKDEPVMISEDEYVIESLVEARKGLSEKETIAVAVLAGMAGYQR